MYRELSHSRRFDQGQPLAVPVSEVVAHCHGLGIFDPDEYAEMLLYVQNMDQVFRENHSKRHAKPTSMEDLRKQAGVRGKS